MNYKEIEVQTPDELQKHILIDNGDGSFISFPVDENNPAYVTFLAQLEQETE